MLAGLVLAALVLTAGLTERYKRIGPLLLLAVSVLWLLTNGPMEGPVLITFARGHGLTAADLAGLAGIGLAVWRYRKHRARWAALRRLSRRASR